MESKTKLFSLMSHGTGHVQESGVIDRAAVEAWRSGVLHKFLAGTYGVSSSHSYGADTMAELQRQLAIGEESASPFLGEVPTRPLEWASLSGRISKSMVCPAVSARKFSSSGICALNKAGLMQSDSACCNMQISGSTPDKLEVLMSETCQKRFIMFDHCGSKKRIIFHPSMLHEISNLLPSNLGSPRIHLNHLQDLSSRAVYQLKETMAVDDAEREATLPSCKGGMHSNYGACLGKIHSSLEPLDLKGAECSPQFDAIAEVETSIGSRNRVSLDYSNGLHEDTDLEALLSSDDEVSTGHSPGDGTWNDGPTSSDNDWWECDQAKHSKKRKREVSDFLNGDDTCSTATSSEVRLKDLNCHCADTSHTGSGSFGLGADRSEEELTAFDIFFPDEVSSKSSATNHGLHRVRGSRHGQHRLPLPVQPNAVKTCRRDKIKDTFRLLRGIIPGGDSMDAAFVLDETIQYVKSLQVQVKVQKLEGRNTSDMG